jgi:hypothetical protein
MQKKEKDSKKKSKASTTDEPEDDPSWRPNGCWPRYGDVSPE